MAKWIPDFRVGDDYNIKLTVNDVAGIAVDITGYKFWLTLKASYDNSDAQAAMQFVTTVGDNVNDEALNGICYLTVPASVTKQVPVGRYYYDIQQKVGSSITTVLPPIADYKDKVVVVPEVTEAIV
jgi:hypothetical protein